MRTIAASSLIAIVVLAGATASIAKTPIPKQGWTVLVCSIFTSASSVAIKAGPPDQMVSIGEWTQTNKATSWQLPAAMAEVEKMSVHLTATPPDQTAKACLLYQQVPRKSLDFKGEASATASKSDGMVPCPCARGKSLDER